MAVMESDLQADVWIDFNTNLERTSVSDTTVDLWYENNLYAQVYGSKYNEQIDRLEQALIVDETGEGNFDVYSLEAGLGKSQNANRIIRDHIELFWDGKPRSFLIVKPFKEDVWATAKFLGEHDAWHNQVLGITSENWAVWKNRLDELEGFQVLVITHARYIKLCEDEEARQFFTKGRHTLVIDEMIQFPTYTFDVSENGLFRKVQSALPYDYHLQSIFLEVCKPLVSVINKWQNTRGSNNWIARDLATIDETVLPKFAQLVNGNEKEINPEGLKKVRELLEVLDVLYHTKFLYNRNKLSGFKREHLLWGLQNNLILDANGASNAIYDTKNIKLISTQRIINYEHSTLHWVKFNSGIGSIRNNQAVYLKQITELIASRHGANDKTLVVCHKEFEKSVVTKLEEHGLSVWTDGQYLGQSIAVAHYGNLVGKNDYGDFTQCWIIGTPNIPMDAHVIHKSQYAKQELTQERYDMHRDGQAYKFVDWEMEQVRSDYVAGEIYQAIRRVQRQPMPQAEIFLVTHNEELHTALAERFQHIKFGFEIELDIGSERKQSARDKKIAALKQYLINLDSGEYRKKDIYDEVGFNPSNASRYWKNINITRMVEAGIIEIRYTKIIKF